jgi:hypothetical protein
MTSVVLSRPNGTQDQVPSSQRIEPGSVNIPIGRLPKTATTTSPAVDEISVDFLRRFNDALSKKDVLVIPDFFLPYCFWRDHLALSWDFRTLKGQKIISDFLAKEGCKLKSIAIDRSSPFLSPQFGPFLPVADAKGITFFIKITTEVGTGRGIVRLAEDDNTWKIFMLSTVLTELTGHEEFAGHQRPEGVEHGPHLRRKNWKEQREADVGFAEKDPAVLIIGASTLVLNRFSRMTESFPIWYKSDLLT